MTWVSTARRSLTRVLPAVVAMFSLPTPGARSGEPGGPPVNVVLVHGILNTGRIFRPLIKLLESENCRCFAPSLRPNTGVSGVHDLAEKLAAQIDQRFGPTAPVVIVGFSLGGLVTRDYVQTLAGGRRVRGVFLISTPNHGTLWACLSPGGGLRDLAIGSPFLQRLNAEDAAWKHIPVSSYWTPYDLMIMPRAQFALGGGRDDPRRLPLARAHGKKPQGDGGHRRADRGVARQSRLARIPIG